MCGVTGILHLTQERDGEIERRAAQMAAAIRHRGPDELGTWSDRECGIALAHSRLAIMEPICGRASADGLEERQIHRRIQRRGL